MVDRSERTSIDSWLDAPVEPLPGGPPVADPWTPPASTGDVILVRVSTSLRGFSSQLRD
jgi:hypothetical protein